MSTARQLRGRQAPIIVLGMHRSGTSAISGLLHAAGINMGWRQDTNAESRFFLRMNRWLLTQCGATWASASDVSAIGAPYLDVLVPAVQRRVESAASLEHFGRTLRSQAWGFKDPRTVRLFWLYDQVFPACKLIIVWRHGVDVAQSLRSRAAASAASIDHGYTAPMIGVRQPGANRLQNALLAPDLDRNFSLWQSYQSTLSSIESSAVSGRVHRLNFEQLVTQPNETLAALSAFVGCELRDTGLRADRAYAYRTSPALVAFATKRKAALAEFGYEP